MKPLSKYLTALCTAMTLTAGSALISYAAVPGWVEENGQWSYYNEDGTRAENTMKKSGSNWFYLDEDGVMAKDTLVETDGAVYYMDSKGLMVTNQWLAVDNENAGEDGEPDVWWYYFQSNGKAVRKSGSGKSLKFVTLSTDSGSSRYVFDEKGHRLFGWLDENGNRLTGDDAWKEGVYYCGDNDDGSVSTGWKYIETPGGEEDDSWFYFDSNGKKTTNSDSKKLNGRKYHFDKNGAARSAES